jgi:hypothetical protein
LFRSHQSVHESRAEAPKASARALELLGLAAEPLELGVRSLVPLDGELQPGLA